MEKNAKKKKTLLIVGIVVAVLVVVYIICVATGNVRPAAEAESGSSGVNQSETTIESGVSQNTTTNEKTSQEGSSYRRLSAIKIGQRRCTNQQYDLSAKYSNRGIHFICWKLYMRNRF